MLFIIERGFITVSGWSGAIPIFLKTFKDLAIEADRRILVSYLSNYVKDGNFQTIWNTHTNINLDDQHLICFDIQKLITSTSGSNNITNAQLFLVLKWIYSQIVENKDYNDRVNDETKLRWIDIFVDEGHVLTTHQNKTPLHFLFTMFKTIRGYSGGIHFITQNIQNLVGNNNETQEYTTGMLNNSQYLFIFGLSANDIKDLDTLLNVIGGLTDYERDFLNSASIGQCIFAPFLKLRFKLSINISDIEYDLYKTKLDLNNLKKYFPIDTDNKVLDGKKK